MIRALFEAGADVFHFNCSHGSHEEHQKHYDIVRAIENETGRPIAVLADLQGPKLRVGRLVDAPITLDEGERVRFDLDPAPGTHDRIPLPHPEVFAALAPGVHLLIDDDKMRLEVEEAAKDSAVALEGSPGIWAIAGDTDGIDGADAAAGAIVTPDTLARATAMRIEPHARLTDNDGHGFFQALGDQLVTGPTLTNVNDFRAILVMPAISAPPFLRT
jgi:hypothetical protein